MSTPQASFFQIAVFALLINNLPTTAIMFAKHTRIV
jgi:hypothetical protein